LYGWSKRGPLVSYSAPLHPPLEMRHSEATYHFGFPLLSYVNQAMNATPLAWCVIETPQPDSLAFHQRSE
jgi:hypothetical protein